jgi:hypothetical protein
VGNWWDSTSKVKAQSLPHKPYVRVPWFWQNENVAVLPRSSKKQGTESPRPSQHQSTDKSQRTRALPGRGAPGRGAPALGGAKRSSHAKRLSQMTPPRKSCATGRREWTGCWGEGGSCVWPGLWRCLGGDAVPVARRQALALVTSFARVCPLPRPEQGDPEPWWAQELSAEVQHCTQPGGGSRGHATCREEPERRREDGCRQACRWGAPREGSGTRGGQSLRAGALGPRVGTSGRLSFGQAFLPRALLSRGSPSAACSHLRPPLLCFSRNSGLKSLNYSWRLTDSWISRGGEAGPGEVARCAGWNPPGLSTHLRSASPVELTLSKSI